MNDKKQIEEMVEEMAKVIGDTWLVDLEGDTMGVCEVLDEVDIEGIARELIEKGYQNCKDKVVFTEEELKKIIQEEYQNALKDKVVLTKEEINDIKVNYFNYGAEQGYEKGRLLGSKATAKEILDKVSRHYGGAWLVELYKEYGVEVE